MVIALIFISMIFTSLAGKRMWFCDDGFFFGDRFFKYKDVDRREPIGGIGSHSLHLVMKDSYSIQINKKMDDKIDNEMKLWKAKKKARSKQPIHKLSHICDIIEMEFFYTPVFNTYRIKKVAQALISRALSHFLALYLFCVDYFVDLIIERTFFFRRI